MKTRPSKLEEVCPARMKPGERRESAATVFGTAVHAALERWREPPHDPFTGEVAEPYTLLDAWDDICCRDSFEGSRPGEEKPNTLSFAQKKEGIKILTHWANEVERERPNVLATEHKFSMVLGDHTIDGTIDAVDIEGKTLVVADYKTGHGYYDAWESAQLACYGIAAANHWDWNGPIKLEFRLVTKGYKRWRYTTREQLMTKDAPVIVNLINRLEAYEESGEWPEVLNQYCAYCSLRESCNTFQSMGLSEIDPDKALEQWREAKLLEGLAKKRAEELKKSAIDGLKGAKSHKGVTRYSSTKRTVDIGRVLDRIPLEALIMVGAVNGVSVTALDRLAKVRPELAETVAECVQAEKTENLRRKKKT